MLNLLGTLNFETFNLSEILARGESLLSCDSQEYAKTSKIQISDQRKALNKVRIIWSPLFHYNKIKYGFSALNPRLHLYTNRWRFLFQKLGLEEASALGLDTSTLFSNEDLMVRNMYLPLYDLFLVMNMCIWFNLLKINFYSLVDQ